MRGFRYTAGDHGGLPFKQFNYNVKDVPDTVDWRLYGIYMSCDSLFLPNSKKKKNNKIL